MPTNFEKGFTIEYGRKDTKRVSCKDCIYYEKDDYSCLKQPVNLREVGFNLWRHCKFFCFDKTSANSSEKCIQLENAGFRIRTEDTLLEKKKDDTRLGKEKIDDNIVESISKTDRTDMDELVSYANEKRIKREKSIISMESAYNEACKQVNDLYNALYIYSIKYHKDLQRAAAKVSEYLKRQNNDDCIDDMMFLFMVSVLLDTNIDCLTSIKSNDIKDAVYRMILPRLDDSGIECDKDDQYFYLKTNISLGKMDMEDEFRRYHYDFFMAINKNVEFDPGDTIFDLKAFYNVTIQKDINSGLYSLSLSIDGLSKYNIGNYLENYEADVYSESNGDLADFFEEHYKNE